jgi:hypothetical protein
MWHDLFLPWTSEWVTTRYKICRGGIFLNKENLEIKIETEE